MPLRNHAVAAGFPASLRVARDCMMARQWRATSRAGAEASMT